MNIRHHSLARRLRISRLLLTLAIMLFGLSQHARAQWSTNGTNVFYNGGNVGIGTSTPGARLDIFSTGTSRVLLGDGCLGSGVYGGIGFGIISFTGCANYSVLGEGTNTFFNAPNGNLYFRVGNVDKMVVTNGGNV